MKNLRQSSLNSNVFNAYVKFQMCVMHNKRDNHVQKIKNKNFFFRYILHSAWELFVYFDILYNIQKALPFVLNTLITPYHPCLSLNPAGLVREG